jgi:hypothetical protein
MGRGHAPQETWPLPSWPLCSECAFEDGAHCRRPPSASALGGGDTVSITPTRDLGEADSAGRFVEDEGDHLRGQGRLPAGAGWSSAWRSRLLGALGEIAIDPVFRNQPRAPLGLDGLEHRDDAPVEGGEADAEGLRGLLASVDEALGRSVGVAVGRDRPCDGARGVL